MIDKRVADLRRMYLEEYRRVHAAEERVALFTRMQTLATTAGLKAWVQFAAGMLASLDRATLAVALRKFEQVAALDPTLAYPWNGRGNVLRQQKKYDEALAAYDKAIALDPAFAYPWNGRGNVLSEQKKYDEALAAYDRAIALDPAFASCWVGRGDILGDLKKYDEALVAYDKAITLDPTIVDGWLGRGNVLSEQKKYDEALAAYDRAIALDPAFASCWVGRGDILGDLKKYDEALVAYDKAIALEPTSGSALYNKGLLLWTMGRLADAHAAFRQALESDLDAKWAGIARMWEQRTAPAKKTPRRRPTSRTKSTARAKPAEGETRSAGFGADLYQTLMSLGLLEIVEESRAAMKAALQKGLGATRRVGTTAEEGALYILRDWNSYTPILPAAFRPETLVSPSVRLGGGYLLSWRNHGVAIDPGINFVDQLYRRGLSIADVDSVVVTHCHLDHTRDVEALVDLNFRFNRNRGGEPGASSFRQLGFYLSPAAHTKYAEYLKSTGCCMQPELMYGGGAPKQITDHIEARPIRVHHQDISSEDEAIGVVFALEREDGVRLLVGLSSDSRAAPALAGRFKGCTVLLVHLGTLETVGEFGSTGLKNHLGLRGCYALMQGVEPRLLVIGEFGEELLESRLEIVRVMAKHKSEKTVCVLGADSNLTISLGGELGVLCSHPACRQVSTRIPISEVVPVIGSDGLFQYYCARHSARSE